MRSNARVDARIERARIDDRDWKKLLVELRRHTGVVYAKAPLDGPQQVRDNVHAGKKRIEQLPTSEFTRCFLQHVLPTGFKRIRHYGILANCHKKEKLAQCRLALQMPQPQAAIIESVQA